MNIGEIVGSITGTVVDSIIETVVSSITETAIDSIAETFKENQEIFKPTEKIGETELNDFEKVGMHEDVKKYLEDFLPSHLENCPRICFEEDGHPDNPRILGEFNTETREITVWGESISTKKELFDTIAHEVGHNVHENLLNDNPQIAAEWKNIYDSCDNFVSEYSKVSEFEGFAEAFAAYRNDPELLEALTPQMYEFMKCHVYCGDKFSISNDAPSSLFKIDAEQVKGLLTNALDTGLKSAASDLGNKALESPNFRQGLAVILSDLVGEELNGNAIKDTQYNRIEIENVKVTSTESGFLLNGDFKAQHTEKFFPVWIPVDGSFSIELHPEFDANVNLQVKSDNLQVNLGDGLVNSAISPFKNIVETSADNAVKEWLDQNINGKSIPEIIENHKNK
jgi:hypothetical protein